jgi:hypothetical protein
MCAHPGVAQDDTDEWGLGIISRVDTPIKSEIIDFPVGSTKVYDEPEGSCVGEITKDEEYSPHYYNVFLVPGIKSDSSAVKREDLREVTYEGTCLKYYEVEDGYVKVLQYTFDDGVWIAIDDLKEDGFAPLSWTDYLLKKKSGFFPRKGYTLKLKENPSSGSKTIIEMQGDAFLIDFTGKYDGGWFEVQVSRFSQYYLSVNEEIPQLYFGWILVLDDRAHPVVWYYTRGC